MIQALVSYYSVTGSTLLYLATLNLNFMIERGIRDNNAKSTSLFDGNR